VLGLIAGGEFQPDPLRNGADVMFGSTHKTFFGPQGGIIVTNRDDIIKNVEANLTWRAIDNAHWNRVAALAQALKEMARFGIPYAQQVVRNARTLGKALDERGFPIKYADQGYTASHQLAIDIPKIYRKFGLEINELAVLFERNNIITDAVGRLGTAEITRLGMKDTEINRLAELMVMAVKQKADVTDEIRLLRKDFEIEYCFK
jgi:glycine hydroxymethyltransferase